MPADDNHGSTLILDTSGAWSTVVVTDGLHVRGVTSVSSRSSENLHSIADTLLRQLKIGIATLGKIAVVVGPGSWTGLNIGVTAAKVLGQVLDIPVASISSLEALAAGCSATTDATCALLDAGRKRVYYLWYTPAMIPEPPRVATFRAWEESLKTRTAPVTVIEYGDTWFAELTRRLPSGCVFQQERLLPEALAFVAARAPGLLGTKCQALVPHYVQTSLFKRDLP